MNNIVIGITDCKKYSNYENWIKNELGVEIIKLGYRENNFDDIKKCNGILLTGGQDVHPRLYNNEKFISYSDPKDIDEKRDEFEWKVLEYSQKEHLPVLGICRGLQITNVFFGGTLVPDILTFGKEDQLKDHDTDLYHIVEVKENSLLKKIVGVNNGEINSSHHQSADNPGKDLEVNAVSPDGIIEGLERKKIDGNPFLLLVQWHPERMKNKENVFSKNIKASFLEEVRKSVER